MFKSASTTTAPSRPLRRYIEELFDAWVFAAHDATQALERWRTSPVDERADAHAVYTAALDREERAASVLAAVIG